MPVVPVNYLWFIDCDHDTTERNERYKNTNLWKWSLCSGAYISVNLSNPPKMKRVCTNVPLEVHDATDNVNVLRLLLFDYYCK